MRAVAPFVWSCWWPLSVVALVLLPGCGAPEQGSIGAVLGRDGSDGSVFIREIAPSSPGAAMPDLTPGDELLMVDGVYVRELSPEQVRARLRGPVGSKVRLTVARGGDVVRLELFRLPLKATLPRAKEERLE